MIDEQCFRDRNILLGRIWNEPLKDDGRVDDQIVQRRPRSRAASASAVRMGLRRSALLTSLENALRVFRSS
ncbi:MAG TPA: hypothetical protein VKB93_10810, partial [Thermoanaerobaculia bacterium]|nr:hypothetical protein [Thermoanaerobaculia bacterium]